MLPKQKVKMIIIALMKLKHEKPSGPIEKGYNMAMVDALDVIRHYFPDIKQNFDIDNKR